MITALGILALLLIAGFIYEQLSRSQDAKRIPPGRLLEVGSTRLHLTDEGEGGPTVVIIPGAGDSSYSWIHIRNQVARTNRVLCYDRPGMGASGPGPGPDATRSVEELHDLLAKAGVEGPFVLVGHSLGGLIARLYVLKYPEQVAGVVMVDSTHEQLVDDPKFRQGFAVVAWMAKLFRALSHVGLPRFLGQVCGVMPMYPERTYYTQVLTSAEYRQWTAAVFANTGGNGPVQETSGIFEFLAAAKQVMRPDQLGDRPLVVLTNPGYGQGWTEMHRELASRSTASVHRIAQRPGHSIQMTSPELVLQAIHEVVFQLRDRVMKEG